MFVIGSRGSDLALAQSRFIQKRILELFPGTDVSIRIIKTTGDKDTVSSIRTGQSIGVFVKELERALLDRKIDLAVHSMKDLPTKIPSDLTIAAIPCREDVRDAFITKNGSRFRDLPSGSRVGTGSLRRQAQLLALRPDLQIKDIRGNVNTRFKKLEEQSYDALVLACAGLNRLEFQSRITEKFTLDQILPAPGQGALAIQTRAGDDRTLQIAQALNHYETSVEVHSERVFLQRVGGGCNIPVAVYSRMEQDRIHITGLIISPDGRKILRDSILDIPKSADEAAVLLADRILNNGGRDILEAL